MLHRYWFVFAPTSPPSFFVVGCGITGYNEADARNLLEKYVFSLWGVAEIQNVIKDVDIRTLDQNHVIPNMGPPSNRGVWYPRMNI